MVVDRIVLQGKPLEQVLSLREISRTINHSSQRTNSLNQIVACMALEQAILIEAHRNAVHRHTHTHTLRNKCHVEGTFVQVSGSVA